MFFQSSLRSSLLPEVPSLASQVCQKEIRLPSHVSYIYYICMLYAERREQYQTILFTLFFLGTKQLQERYSGEYWTSGQSALYFACFAARLQLCNSMSIRFVDFICQCNIRIYSNKLSNCKIHQTQQAVDTLN